MHYERVRTNAMLWKSFIAAFVSLAASFAVAANLPVIMPEDAAAKDNQEVIVEFTVNSARLLDAKHVSFLNSESDIHSEKNFTAFITPKGMRAFKAERKIENPGAEYIGKKIRVEGKIKLHNGRPEIEVVRPDQVQLVEES